jgi:mannosyltransferase
VAASARRVNLPVSALTALVLALGFAHLGAKSVWLDESISVGQATKQGVWVTLTGRGDNMGLHSFLLHVWIKAFGESEIAIRSLSVFFAALCVPAVYLAGRRLFDRRAGLVAAVLLAPNAFFVQWAQQARGYTLLILLVTLSSYFFLGELERPSRANRVAYVVSSAAALDAHSFAAFVVLAQLLTVLALRRRAAFTKSWLGVAAAIAVLGLPEGIHALDTGAAQLSWISTPNGASLRKALLDLGGGGWWALAVLLGGCGLAVLRAMKVGDRWRECFLATWLVVPVALSFAGSFVQPMFLSRYLLVSLPALVLLAARGLTKLPSPALLAALVAVACAFGLQVSNWYAAPAREDWRAATRYVLASTHPGDAVLYYPTFAQTPFAYYERLDGGRAGTPPATLPHLGSDPRVWLVIRKEDAVRDPRGLQTLAQALASGYGISQQRSFSGVQVALYIRRA